MNRKAILLISAFLLFPFSLSVHAYQSHEITKNDWGKLPKWCRYVQTIDQNRSAPGHYNDYIARYGDGWKHVHHYCWALVSIHRMRKFNTNAMERRHYLSSAIGDLNYVLRNTRTDFVLRLEVFYRKCALFLEADQKEQARDCSNTMVKEWPTKSLSYQTLAEVHLRAGNRAKARAVLDDARSKVTDAARIDAIISILKL